MIFIEVQLPALVLLLVGTLVCGTAPIVLHKVLPNGCAPGLPKRKKDRRLSFLIYLGNGFLFAVAMLYLVPQVHQDMSVRADELTANNSHLHEMEQVVDSHDNETHHHHHHHHHHSFPIPEFTVACGFFLTYLIEVLMGLCTSEAQEPSREPSQRVRAKFCSCSQRNIECSRIYKPDVSHVRIEKRKRSATWAGQILENPNPQEHHECPPDLLQSSLIGRPFPNYGAAMASEPLGLPVRVDGITIVSRPSAPPLPRIAEVPNASESTTLLSTVAVLSLYSTFEGLAIGFQKSAAATWAVLLAVAVHQFFNAFLVGVEGIAEKCKISHLMGYMLTLALVSPASMAVAISLVKFRPNLVISVLNGISAGGLLYVSCFEEFPKRTNRHSCNQFRFLGTLIGAGIMAGVQYVLY